MFCIRIYDNFHYNDQSEAFDYKKYKTYEEALAAARSIVRSSLQQEYKPGMKEDELLAMYCLYGDDPAIMSEERADFERFSARDYAEEIAAEICAWK